MIFIKTQNGNSLAPVGIHFTILKSQDMFIFKKMADRRRMEFLGKRISTLEELNNEGFSGPRIGFSVYNDWDRFIQDELKYTADPDWISQLNQWKEQYPQFNTHNQISLF